MSPATNSLLVLGALGALALSASAADPGQAAGGILRELVVTVPAD